MERKIIWQLGPTVTVTHYSHRRATSGGTNGRRMDKKDEMKDLSVRMTVIERWQRDHSLSARL